MVTMLVNGCDTRISSRLVPSVPSPTEVDAEMEDILKKNGIDYSVTCSLLSSLVPSNHPTIMDPNGNGSVTPNPFNNPATISPIPTVSPMQTSPFPAPQFPPTLQPSLPPFPNTNGGSFSNPPSNSVFPTL